MSTVASPPILSKRERTGPSSFRVMAVQDLPEIEPGKDLASMLSAAFVFEPGDVLVVAQKIVSKSEGRLVPLNTVATSAEAEDLAARTGKDPRLVQLILE